MRDLYAEAAPVRSTGCFLPRVLERTAGNISRRPPCFWGSRRRTLHLKVRDLGLSNDRFSKAEEEEVGHDQAAPAGGSSLSCFQDVARIPDTTTTTGTLERRRQVITQTPGKSNQNPGASNLRRPTRYLPDDSRGHPARLLLLFSSLACNGERGTAPRKAFPSRTLPHGKFRQSGRAPRRGSDSIPGDGSQNRPGQADDPGRTSNKAARRKGPEYRRSLRPLFSLAEAIETAFRLQPRLRVYLENVGKRAGEDIAFAPFLPMAAAGYSVGGFDLNAGGLAVPLGPIPGFTFIPAIGSSRSG